MPNVTHDTLSKCNRVTVLRPRDPSINDVYWVIVTTDRPEDFKCKTLPEAMYLAATHVREDLQRASR